MYKISIFSSFILLCLFLSCSKTRVEQERLTQKPYFDLNDYFEKEAIRLSRKNPQIVKTVYKNREKESKNIRLNNWEDEFSFYILSDINKPDWLNSYTKDSIDSRLIYTSRDPRLRTKQITIFRGRENNVTHIAIVNIEKNWLYESTEKLDYYPDSMYSIYKEQTIRFIGTNTYQVTGQFL